VDRPFTQRVLVLAEVADEDEEVALVRGVLEGRGWPVREPRAAEWPDPVPGRRRALVVEIRLNGARWRAEHAARGIVETLTRRHKLALWVRDAALVTPPAELAEQRVTYRVVRKAGGTGLLHRLWTRLGGRDTRRLLRLPVSLTREEVERELSARRLAGHHFATAEHELLPPPPEDEDAAARRRVERPSAAEMARFIAALLAALGSGYALREISGLALGIPLAVLLLCGAALSSLRWPDQMRPPTRVAAGLLFSGGLALMGWMVAGNQSPEGSGLGGPVGTWLLAGLILLGLPGVHFALRQTWVSRNAVWLVPVAIPVAWSMVAWLGRLMRAVYLEAFGIPSGSVRSTESLYDYAAAAEPLAIALAFALLFIGALGWMRYAYLALGDNRLFAVVTILVLSVVYALTAIGLGVEEADSAARRAMAEAGEGRDPSDDYFGLQGELVCVRPVGEDPIPVENGPVPVDHPVLSFGSSEDWIWLWDPVRADDPEVPDTVVVRRDDVQLVAPDGGC
jgi:hypothetical protein